MVINIISKVKKNLPLSNLKIEKTIKIAAKELKIKQNFELTLVIVGPAEIRKLNKKYRNQDKITDVLSFAQLEGPGLIIPENQLMNLGDIIICLTQLEKQAKQLNHSAAQEFIVLIIHGFLHLLDYDHIKEQDYILMKKTEDRLLKKIYA